MAVFFRIVPLGPSAARIALGSETIADKAACLPARAILNAMWYEVRATDAAHRKRNDGKSPNEPS